MKLKFGTRIIIFLIAAVTLTAFAAIFVAGFSMREQGSDDLVKKSRAILSRLNASTQYVAKQGGLPLAVETAKKNFPDGKLSDEEKLKVLKQVPIFAAMQIGSADADKEHYIFRIFSDEPRN
jgi:methyl-accepting chemotaxis protein